VNLSSTTLSTRLKEARTTGLVQIRAAEEGPKPVIVYGLSPRSRKVIETLQGLRKSLRED
jgi:DNA-binding HxlR family transcriptional regulator